MNADRRSRFVAPGWSHRRLPEDLRDIHIFTPSPMREGLGAINRNVPCLAPTGMGAVIMRTSERVGGATANPILSHREGGPHSGGGGR